MAEKQNTVLIGAGGIGLAIVRKLGVDQHVLCADLNQETAAAAVETLKADGISAEARTVDITDRSSINDLVKFAQNLGGVHRLILATGVSPSRTPSHVILKVDFYGVALVLDEFVQAIAQGGVGLVVGSQAGHRLPALSVEQDQQLAGTPVDQLLDLPLLNSPKIKESLYAYQLAKRGCSLRVKSESIRWSQRGARLNVISPGFVSTGLSEAELSGPHAAHYKKMLAAIACGRPGKPEEVARLAAFLLGPESEFISGSDFLIDGGVTAANRFGDLELEF